ncbi:MAG: M20 family metallopeptidase [Sedimentisphaerales bacterium]|nr:M20 family metallopeptidase [Sedimentisphaerales bacterium]
MIRLLRKLIQARTTVETGELAAAKLISDELSKSGVDSQIDCWDKKRANITAKVNSTGHKGALMFACHLDVVPPGKAKWQYPPFDAFESNGKIYGRGSTDMKGSIAAVITAIRQVVESGTKLQGDIILLAAAGEENDSCGAKRFMQNFQKQAPQLAGVIVTEPTDFEVVNTHRGLLWLKITTKGKTAHGSMPQLGINAISSMKSLLDELQDYEIPCEPHELLGRCSMSINTISAGQAVNVVPDRCTIGIDIRTLPGQDNQALVKDLEKNLVKLKEKNPKFDAEVSIVRDVPPLETDSKCDFVKDFCSAVGAAKTQPKASCTDGPCFVPLRAPIVIFGPGQHELCHQPNEFIQISDVEKGVEYYKKIICKFLC